jgi:hypothetical protein
MHSDFDKWTAQLPEPGTDVQPLFAREEKLLYGPAGEPVSVCCIYPTEPLHGGTLAGMRFTYLVSFPNGELRRVYEYALSAPGWSDERPDWLN